MSGVLFRERPPMLEDWLARRRELGQDRYDEMWDGVYHVAPGPSAAHGLVDSELSALLRERAIRVGLVPTTSINVGTSEDFRVPDGALHRDRPTGVFLPTAAMVIEIVSPGDESLQKFEFYAAHRVDEVLVADPETRTVRIWQLRRDSYFETGYSALVDIDAARLAVEIDWP